jgi:hypothetical protein
MKSQPVNQVEGVKLNDVYQLLQLFYALLRCPQTVAFPIRIRAAAAAAAAAALSRAHGCLRCQMHEWIRSKMPFGVAYADRWLV